MTKRARRRDDDGRAPSAFTLLQRIEHRQALLRRATDWHWRDLRHRSRRFRFRRGREPETRVLGGCALSSSSNSDARSLKARSAFSASGVTSKSGAPFCLCNCAARVAHAADGAPVKHTFCARDKTSPASQSARCESSKSRKCIEKSLWRRAVFHRGAARRIAELVFRFRGKFTPFASTRGGGRTAKRPAARDGHR